MSDPSGLLAGILANPDDDAPRLVYADWLDEHGDEARAAFIRCQCRIIEMQTEFDPQSPLPPAHPAHKEYEALRRREADLFLKHGRQWLPFGWQDSSGTTLAAVTDCRFVHPEKGTLFYRRGFVESVRITLAAWRGGECENCGGEGEDGGGPCTHCGGSYRPVKKGSGRLPGVGPALVAVEPVVSVVTEREPDVIGHGHPGATWFIGDALDSPHHIPNDLWRIMGRTDFPTHAAALAAFSDALLAEAKDEARQLAGRAAAVTGR